MCKILGIYYINVNDLKEVYNNNTDGDIKVAADTQCMISAVEITNTR